MYLSNLQIRNFRNYESEYFEFTRETNTIIGENDAGKTNALTALRILLDDSYYYSNKTLKESDFFSEIDGGWRGEWIIIAATFEGITEEELNNEVFASLSVNSANKIDDVENTNALRGLISNTSVEKGSINLYIRPNKNIRKQLFNAKDDTILFDEIRSSIRLTDYEFFYTSKSNLDFSHDDNYCQLMGDLNSYEATDPDEDDEALLGAKIDMADVFKHISVVYIDALRDVLREMKKHRNPVKRIVETIESKISVENIDTLKLIIQNLNTTITNVPEIKNIGEDLNRQLNGILGSVYSPTLLLSSTLSDDMSSLAKFLSMRPEEDIDLDLLGLGHLNMIYLALKIVEFEACRSRELLNIMLIEEPEAHIHHHIQKTLFEGLSLEKTYTQILMTTHSVHLAEASEISKMSILKSFNNSTIVMQPSKNLNIFAEQRLEKKNLNLIKAVERYLDVKRNGLLFSKGVVLVEGDAEEILIPEIIKKVFGVNLDELGIGLINVGSTAFEYVASLFHDDRIKRNCAIVTDLDKQVIPETDSLYKKTAEDNGLKRKEKLTRLFDDNKWIKTFYADTTFELEFLESNKNITKYVKSILDDTFDRPTTVQKYISELEGQDDLKRNLAMLKLAREVGKGWFAIELGQNLDIAAKIPHYIIDAIAFACQESVDISIYKKIVLYTLNYYDKEKDSKIVQITNKIDSNNEYEIKEGINEFLDCFFEEDEDSVRFINQMDNYLNILGTEVVTW
ncbi:AAA family ATPase [Virgibacillus pantothenticus]|uniref:ATP-dependent nuclease n=1 Tax=Virgibacillus pantothenticus TaxID=1473 RepID=UPI001C22E69A|nr:AAA family ATPase [Virgibacillus pantothenticus]MBU8568044.1 AAA family ATPase [Virgibacillus pantothenticus]MBU8601990.1 AAA family ATPase [Virgibacillus pantothenticus]MBU8636240.1 AAA family ATPase [Virgibacillus pantothenticus]MBU8643760.1 AAA family ATPase [Virgibacillus pantothenticus]MBU8648076.1 AAA family ATPase [Virgibacillus pantothenticus]